MSRAAIEPLESAAPQPRSPQYREPPQGHTCPEVPGKQFPTSTLKPTEENILFRLASLPKEDGGRGGHCGWLDPAGMGRAKGLWPGTRVRDRHLCTQVLELEAQGSQAHSPAHFS